MAVGLTTVAEQAREVEEKRLRNLLFTWPPNYLTRTLRNVVDIENTRKAETRILHG